MTMSKSFDVFLGIEQEYKFFFSYARNDYESSKRTIITNDGSRTVNYLEIFFEEVSKEVSSLTGENPDKVVYCDIERLKISDYWNKQLVEGLQNSSVLLAIISPAYLKSWNCGREVQFFIKRSNRLRLLSGQQQSHQIIPVFWEDASVCFRGLDKNVSKFLKEFQWSQTGMPENYPSVGIGKMYKLMSLRECAQVVAQIAKRIVEIAAMRPELPQLGEDDFSEMPSAWDYISAAPEDISEIPKRLSQSCQAALLWAEGFRQVANSEEIYTEYLLAGLYQNVDGTAYRLLTLFDDATILRSSLERLANYMTDTSVRFEDVRPASPESLGTALLSANAKEAPI